MGSAATSEPPVSESKASIKDKGAGHHVYNDQPYQIVMTGRSLIVSFIALSLISYGFGSTCHGGEIGNKISSMTGILLATPSKNQDGGLPPIVVPSGKAIPKTTYTSRQFSMHLPNSSATMPFESFARRPKLDEPSYFEVFADGNYIPINNEQRSNKGDDEDDDDESEDEDEEEDNDDDDADADEDDDDDEEEKDIKPMLQHLMVDIEKVDSNFLNSEERLATAMLELVKECDETMLSYHCHTLEPSGISCIGILVNESHVSFHTWPGHGFMVFDMLTTCSLPLKNLLSHIDNLFGVPKEPVNGEKVLEPPRSKWVHKERGFDHDLDKLEAQDYKTDVLGIGGYPYREEVVFVETDYQTIHIVDVIDPKNTLDSYKKSLSKDGSYESDHPELFQPDRIVFLDMVQQSSRYGDAAYHESLVHPAMFAHDEPRRVAIIGGGEGATLREVLKHNTLEKVVMIEIDEIMVNVSRQYLPEWSDCSNIAGSKPSCFDDPRAEVYYEDAIAWFIDRYSEGVEFDPSDRFDVIIMDALDPSSATAFSDILYNNYKLMTAIENSLTEEGILISQVGESEEGGDPPDVYTRESTVDTGYIPQLIKHGFERIQGYEDMMHGGFGATWSYLIAFQDVSSSENWYGNQASIDLEIRHRILPTVSGESPLRYFDGATFVSMSLSSKFEEQTFCLNDDTPRFCDLGHGFDPDKPNVPISSLELKESSIPGAGLGLFTKVDIVKGSYVAIDEVVHNMMVFPSTNKMISDMAQRNEMAGRWGVFEDYLFGYGFATDYYGDPSYSLDTGILAFMNHGCGGKYNIGTQTTVTEMSADPKELPPELATTYESEVYNPFVFRNSFLLHHLSNVRKDITAGDEILDNFLGYLHEVNWEKGVLNYRSSCTTGEAYDGISSSS